MELGWFHTYLHCWNNSFSSLVLNSFTGQNSLHMQNYAQDCQLRDMWVCVCVYVRVCVCMQILLMQHQYNVNTACLRDSRSNSVLTHNALQPGCRDTGCQGRVDLKWYRLHRVLDYRGGLGKCRGRRDSSAARNSWHTETWTGQACVPWESFRDRLGHSCNEI